MMASKLSSLDLPTAPKNEEEDRCPKTKGCRRGLQEEDGRHHQDQQGGAAMGEGGGGEAAKGEGRRKVAAKGGREEAN